MTEFILYPFLANLAGNLGSHASIKLWESISADYRKTYNVKTDITTFIIDTLTAIRAVLQDAEAKQYADDRIKIWLADLKSFVYELDDLCDQIAYDGLLRENKDNFAENLRYYLSLSSNPLNNERKWVSEIENLLVKLDSIVVKKNDWGLTDNAVEASAVQKDLFEKSSFVKKSDILGRDNDKEKVLGLLASHNTAICPLKKKKNTDNDKCPYILPIVGIGGIGKTAFAKLVYADLPFKKNDESVDHGQFTIKMWACVSHKDFDVTRLLVDLIKDATGDDKSNLTLTKLVENFQELIQDKKYCIVLDDVWLEDIRLWTDLESIFEGGKEGSVILITTRKPKTAKLFSTDEQHYYTLSKLSDDVCESIFDKIAFRKKTKCPDALLDLRTKIVRNCSGNPLVVKSLGGLLFYVSEHKEWEHIINLSIDQDERVRKILKLSYDNLSPHLKICFLYCALVEKNGSLFPSYLSGLWSAHGVLKPPGGNSGIEEDGHKVMMDLVSQGLLEQETCEFNDTLYNCKMHDLMHDLGAKILGEELTVVTRHQAEVSEFTKHIIWGRQNYSSGIEKGFPVGLRTADRARTFMFICRMNTVKEEFLDDIISSFKRLRFLQFSYSKFEKLPESIEHLIHLRVLMLSYNPDLKSLPESICYLLNLERLHFRHCGNLEKLPEKIGQLVNLRNLAMTICSQTTLANTTFNKLRSLRHLWIVACKKLESLWSDNDDPKVNLISIQRLCIEDCPLLTKLPKQMKQLEQLEIKKCGALNLEDNECLRDYNSLQTLLIEGLPQMKGLPKGIESAARSLQYLSIKDCLYLEQLVLTLENFVALRKIRIHNCPSMIELPQGFHRLRDLQELDVHGCPQLSKKYAVTNGEGYSLIEHVRKFVLDGQTYPGTPQQTP